MMREVEYQVNLQGEYSSGRQASLEFRYLNRNRYHHKISRVFVSPSWDSYEYYWDVDVDVPPMDEVVFENLPLALPVGLGGTHGLEFGAEVTGVSEYTGSSTDQRTYWTESPLHLNLNYQTFNAFVSRSNHPKDVEISDTLNNMIRDWGFKTTTLFDRVDEPKEWLKDNMMHVDCLFGIAVPRYETVDGERPQFHYLDGETGMALIRDIPVVVFEHEDVDLTALPSECTRIPFKDPNSEEFRKDLNNIMLSVRQQLQQNKRQQSNRNLVKAGAIVAAFAILFGNSDSNSDGYNEEDNLD